MGGRRTHARVWKGIADTEKEGWLRRVPVWVLDYVSDLTVLINLFMVQNCIHGEGVTSKVHHQGAAQCTAATVWALHGSELPHNHAHEIRSLSKLKQC